MVSMVKGYKPQDVAERENHFCMMLHKWEQLPDLRFDVSMVLGPKPQDVA